MTRDAQRTTMPRLAETAEELWRKTAELAQSSVHEANYGWLYPTMVAVGVGTFQIAHRQVLRVYPARERGAAMASRVATAAELNDRDRAIANDTVQIVLLSGWNRHRPQEIVRVLHQPRGFAWSAQVCRAKEVFSDDTRRADSVGDALCFEVDTLGGAQLAQEALCR